MIINLTPHPIHIFEFDGTQRTIAPEAQPARCAVERVMVGGHDGIPLYRTQFGSVTGLPDPQPDVLYVVSLPVRQALPERTDLANPDDVVRDEAGKIVGCRGLAIN